jgi:hypothetical protein
MTELAVYDIFQGQHVRKVDRGDGKVWRVFADCCKALGFQGKPSNQLNRIPKQHTYLIGLSAQDGRTRKQWVINEEGLISLIAYSRLPKEQLDAFRELIGQRAAAPTMAMADPMDAVKVLAQGMVSIDERLKKLEAKREAQALLEAPAIPIRKQIVRLVRDFIHNHPDRYTYYDDAFHSLYGEFKYTYGIDAALCAANRSIKVIEYIEQIGKLPELLAVANKLFDS